MYCSRCGSRNEDDAKYCDTCGADLGPMPRPPSAADATSPASPTPRPAAPPPRTVYAPARRHAWWFPIGVWVLLAVFFLFVNAMSGASIWWAVWPVGLTGIFMVGLPLLWRIERWSQDRASARSPR